jgi:Fe-S cluster biogenesis protein NfuA
MSAPVDGGDLRERIAKTLAEEVLPALQMDGAAMEVIEVVEGVVRVRLHGTCGGCPSTVMAVILGVEQELRQRVPEVEYLEVTR